MIVTRYIVLAPFNGWKKGQLLTESPDLFWIEKGYASRIEIEESEIIEHPKHAHGRPLKIPTSPGAEGSE